MNPLIVAWLQALGGLLAAGLILRYLHALRLRLREALRLWSRGPGLKVGGRELVPRSPVSNLLVTLEEVCFFVAGIGVAYLAVYYALSRFAATENAAERLLLYAVDPLTQAGKAVLGYVPSAFFIVVTAGLLYLLLQVLHLAFERIARGAIHFESFPADWALPTYKIVRFLVLVFGAVIIWPYLPGSESEAFKGISLFVGVLISLSSSSALANLIAGVILTYTRAFQPGDRIRVGQTEGMVTEKTLLITRLCNAHNIVVTVPNAKLLSEPIQNLGGVSKQAPLMLSCSVTIGYDVPWKQVHALLLGALEGQPEVLSNPEPKVWQRSLQDFYVHYELCFHTNSPRLLETTQSLVNAAIQDRFAVAGIEIMSPHYYADRDGNKLALPPQP